MTRLRLAACTALLLAADAAAGERAFAPRDIAEWETRTFEGETRYRLDPDGGRPALIATADGTASARYHEVEIDLTRTPILEWSWRVEALPEGDAGEREKAGDDYAARVYVVREGLFGRLSAKALNYVWSRREPAGAAWPNAYTGRAHMRAVASGPARTGEWTTHRRDVRADWRAAFEESIERIDGIAIMTDADDTGSRARARYGTIRFRGAVKD